MPYRTFIATLCVCLSLSMESRAEDPQPAAPNQWDGVYVKILGCSELYSIHKECEITALDRILLIENNTIPKEYFFSRGILGETGYKEEFKLDKNGHLVNYSVDVMTAPIVSIDIKADFLSMLLSGANTGSTSFYVRIKKPASPI